ncbi:hypothetical protein V5O48_019369, partial [Marasmius crinis-equi]
MSGPNSVSSGIDVNDGVNDFQWDFLQDMTAQATPSVNSADGIGSVDWAHLLENFSYSGGGVEDYRLPTGHGTPVKMEDADVDLSSLLEPPVMHEKEDGTIEILDSDDDEHDHGIPVKIEDADVDLSLISEYPAM